jgi:hypothetical protein
MMAQLETEEEQVREMERRAGRGRE